jgi:50S ribosomal protein L16 3-hydroxylase
MAVLGDMSADVFLKRFWQREPLLVRGAFEDTESLLGMQDLFDLSEQRHVESRLIAGDAPSNLTLQHGPFVSSSFASRQEAWTLLVQAVDLWRPAIGSLISRFGFLPPWRFDDVMVSYATAGGGVGPHYDEYDVFLVQLSGTRQWQIGGYCAPDTRQVSDSGLKLLEDFEAIDEWLLEPGDMLYVPPRWSHWGTSRSPGMTASIGFRSPSLADMLGDLAIEIIAQDQDRAYRDPPLTSAMAGDSIHPQFVTHAARQLIELLSDEQIIGDWFARYMSAPKYPDLVAQSHERRQVLISDRLYVNGEPADFES